MAAPFAGAALFWLGQRDKWEPELAPVCAKAAGLSRFSPRLVVVDQRCRQAKAFNLQFRHFCSIIIRVNERRLRDNSYLRGDLAYRVAWRRDGLQRSERRRRACPQGQAEQTDAPQSQDGQAEAPKTPKAHAHAARMRKAHARAAQAREGRAAAGLPRRSALRC